jgi:hypothetical protein
MKRGGWCRNPVDVQQTPERWTSNFFDFIDAHFGHTIKSCVGKSNSIDSLIFDRYQELADVFRRHCLTSCTFVSFKQ